MRPSTRRTAALGLVAAALAASAAAADLAGGAIFATRSDGVEVNDFVFPSLQDVYVNGTGLPEGEYYVRVTTPNGATLLGTSVGSADETPIEVGPDGAFSEAYRLWDLVNKASDGSPGFDPTTGEFCEGKIWVSGSAGFGDDCSLVDLFDSRVKEEEFEHVCPPSSISSNFNGTAIAAGRTVWFNSVLKVKGLGTAPARVRFRDQTISFTANGIAYEIPVPDAEITYDPTASVATTAYDATDDAWTTVVRGGGSLSGNQWLSGVAFPVPAGGLPGGIGPVTWAGQFSSDTDGLTIEWKWAAGVYSAFGSLDALGVKPVDDKTSAYQNSDHAGTPESFKSCVVGGARGGGGSNFTGSYSGTASCR